MDYQELKQEYSRNGLIHKQLKRTPTVAIYEQFMPDGLKIGFEIFKIIIVPSYTFPNGVICPKQESYPGDSKFGVTAFAYSTLEDAMKKFDEMCAGIIKQPKEKIAPLVIDPNAPKRGRGRPRKNPNAPIVPYVKKGRKTFVYEGKEYKSKAEVGRILLTAGEGKVAIAKKLKCSQQSVHGWWVLLNPNVVKKRRKA